MNQEGNIAEEIRRADAVAEVKDRAYETKYAARFMFTWQNEMILTVLAESTNILEIGAGIGNFLVDAVSHLKSIHATEVSSVTAVRAQQRAPTIRSMSLAPAESLPFRTNAFDGLVARGILHHLESPKRGIQEMYRILQPGGRLIIFEGNPTSTYRRLVLGTADLLGINHEVSQHRHLTPDEIYQLLGPFRHVQCLSVNGILAPVAYTGLGGPKLWNVLQKCQTMFSRLLPDRFNWWLLWIAQK